MIKSIKLLNTTMIWNIIVYNFHKYVPYFCEISSTDTKFDALNKFYKNF